ncbi:MAG: iron-containing alcohol dehydrogenase [Deltaproteobacteria bacterium]|nr:iron-containing alcohol dehydrogenase [Deltaproteobacteria bacterium]MBW2659666.1 iron-containing alcohol dehydrogenase [Deltaproteobacteria bacterium]
MNSGIAKFSFPTTIYFGAGAIDNLPQYLQDITIKKPLLVTDPGMLKTDVFPKVEGILKSSGIAFGLFSRVNPNPLDSDIQKAVDIYSDEGCDGVIGLGGGSALDAAKMVQVIAGHGGKVNDYDISTGGNQNIRGPLPPMIAVPTTSGTGSEVGSCSVITSVALGRKFLVCSPLLIPSIALLDPELTLGMPAALTAGTGMDAFTHCLEALSVKDFHPMCDAIALKGIEFVAQYLETAVKEPDNIEARGHMQLAAMMGAVAFQKDLGAAHSLSHSLSAVCHVPHGLANAICLEPVMKFNRESCLEEYAKVAACFGVNTFDMSLEEAAGKAIEAVTDLKKRIGIPEKLSAVGVKEEDLEELTEKAFLDGCHQSNPRSCTRENLRDLYREVL